MNTVERIGSGIDWWLSQEACESRTGRNAVLDDFTGFRAGLLHGRKLEHNSDFQKISGHIKRFHLLAGMIDQIMLQDDYAAGKFVHHSLMFVSGGFRLQCFLQAANQAEYEALRFEHLDAANGASGVPISESVANGLRKASTVAGNNGVDYEHLRAASIAGAETVFKDHIEMYDWFSKNSGRASDRIALDEEPVQAILHSQREGIALAALHIAVAARLRGDDLSRAPFLEPKSITDASTTPIYPLAV